MVVWNLSVIVDCVMPQAYQTALHCASVLHYHGVAELGDAVAFAGVERKMTFA
jgi:hypothetical protein